MCEVLGLWALASIPASFKLLLLECLLSMATDIGCFFNPMYSGRLHNIFVLVDFAILLPASATFMPKSARTASIGISLLVFGLAWYLSIVKGRFDEFANYAFAVGSLLVTILFLLVLYTSETMTSNKLKLPIRLVCLGLILYHTGTFVFVLGVHYLMNDNMPEAIVDINTTLDSLKYLLIAIAFYLFKKKSVSWAATT